MNRLTSSYFGFDFMIGVGLLVNADYYQVPVLVLGPIL
jgi:hypothetical protein